MHRLKKLFWIVALFMVLGLIGCNSSPTPTQLALTATEHAYPPPMYDPDEVVASLTSVPEVGPLATATEASENDPPE